MSVAIAEAITTLTEAEQRFHLSRTEAGEFFLEWWTDLPELTDAEKTGLAEMVVSIERCHYLPPTPMHKWQNSHKCFGRMLHPIWGSRPLRGRDPQMG